MGGFECIKKRKIMSLHEMEPEDQAAKSWSLQNVGRPLPPRILKNGEKNQFLSSGTTFWHCEDVRAADKTKAKKVLPRMNGPVMCKKSKVSPLAKVAPEKKGKVQPVTIDMNTSSSDFAALSQLPNYVDQTLVVARIQYGSSVTLATAPKKWGKSTAISTLKYFYEIEVKPNGEKVTKTDIPSNIADNPSNNPKDDTVIKDTPNYELFNESKLALKKPEVMEHLGKYPVILVEFKNGVKDCEAALENCRYAIHRAYEQHKYLKTSTKIEKVDPEMISCIKKWCGRKSYKNMDWDDVVTSIRDLSQYLSIHWDRKCVILIDDYDAITVSCLNSKCMTSDEFINIQDDLTSMLSNALKGNEDNLHKGFITGISYAAGLWSSLNNLEKCRFSERHNFSEFYGFTEVEVKSLLQQKERPFTFENVRDFYNGYRTFLGKSIYCPWSIINALNHGELRRYWCDSSLGFLLFESFSNLSMRKKMQILIGGKTVEVNVTDTLTGGSFNDIKNYIEDPSSSGADDLVLSLFIDQGYLIFADVSKKPVSKATTNITNTEASKEVRRVKIPNEEIKDCIRIAMFTHLWRAYSKFRTECHEVRISFEKIFLSVNSSELLRTAMTNFLKNMEELLQATHKEKKEMINQEVIRNLLVVSTFSDCPVFYPEFDVDHVLGVESGGKVDYCTIYEKYERKIALVLEIKVNESMEQAKEQIISRQYFRALDYKRFKGAEEAIIMGLCITRPRKTKRPPKTKNSELNLKMIYTLREGCPNTTEAFTEKVWSELTYPE